MNDTLPEVELKMRQLMMSRSGAERFLMGASMFESARAIVLASLSKNLSPEELRSSLCERFYGVTLEDFMKGAPPK